MPPKGCHGHSIRGSGYVKPDGNESQKMEEEVKKRLEARATQDAVLFPRLPVSPLRSDRVAGRK